jgi:hypothetical protein
MPAKKTEGKRQRPGKQLQIQTVVNVNVKEDHLRGRSGLEHHARSSSLYALRSERPEVVSWLVVEDFRSLETHQK